MPIFLRGMRIAYYPIPCCGSSSIKVALLRLMTGATVSCAAAHEVWESHEFIEPPPDVFAFTVVRDPIDRFETAYRRWVIDGNALGDSPPSIDEVALNINEHRRTNYLLDHHMRPINFFVGSLPNSIRVFCLDELDKLPDAIERATGHRIELEHLNDGPDMHVSSPEAIEVLKAHYSDCYRLIHSRTRGTL